MKGSVDPIQFSRDLVLLSRPQDFLYAGLLTGVTSRFAAYSWDRTGVAVGLLFGLYTLAVIYNNKSDLKIDKLNKRSDNPLIAGRITQIQLLGYGLLISLWIVLALILLNSAWVGVLSLIYIILLLSYSHPSLNVQARGIFAFVPLIICYGCIPVLIGFGGHVIDGVHWAIVLLQPLVLLPMLLAKDYKDIKGDTKYGKKTFLVRHGPQATRRLAVGLAFFLLVTLIYIVSVHDFSSYLPIVGVIYVFLIAYIHKKQAIVHKEVKRLVFALIFLMMLLIWNSSV